MWMNLKIRTFTDSSISKDSKKRTKTKTTQTNKKQYKSIQNKEERKIKRKKNEKNEKKKWRNFDILCFFWISSKFLRHSSFFFDRLRQVQRKKNVEVFGIIWKVLECSFHFDLFFISFFFHFSIFFLIFVEIVFMILKTFYYLKFFITFFTS